MTPPIYLTLPSNNLSGFSTNTISNFKTKLRRRFSFPKEENWSVGLAEISYSKSWYNVRTKHQIILFDAFGDIIHDLIVKKPENTSNVTETTISRSGNEEVSTREVGKSNIEDDPLSDCCIKPGFYESIQVLCDYINKKFELFESYVDRIPNLKYNKISNRVTLKAGEKDGIIGFPYLGEEVETILGLADYKSPSLYNKASFVRGSSSYKHYNKYMTQVINIFGEEKNKSHVACELNAGFQSLFLYCDIIEHNFVGDDFAQLLRLVEVPNNLNFSDTVVVRYDQPHYIPLQTREFDIIEVDVKDDTGQNIPFEFGKIIVKLILQKDV